MLRATTDQEEKGWITKHRNLIKQTHWATANRHLNSKDILFIYLFIRQSS